MTIPLEGSLMCRRTAPFHVQLKLEQARDLQQASGEIQIHGLAVRLFRTDGRLTLGDHVEFPLWVCHKGDEPTGPAFIYHDALAGAEYMEAYLYLAGSPPRYQLAAYEFCVLNAPSDQPALTPEQLEELETPSSSPLEPDGRPLRRWSWQFWK
jgi:hypothetical protein